MRIKIKNKIEKELFGYVCNLGKNHSLKNISPLLFHSLKDFILRPGKRVRPTLLVAGYMGFNKKPASGLYTSALSIELLHDFMLVHDDIIDKSATRRGKPSMHAMLNAHLKRFQEIKFNGQDLAIVVGDVLYALGINAFLEIKVNPLRKEKGLKMLVDAALYTGGGEFIELIDGVKDISRITRTDIYKIYDYKTAYYTFAYPLAIGATLGGASALEADKLFRYGVHLGRAFQIKDDILGMFGNERTIGKSTLTDLQEAKKTILIWYAYNHSGAKNRSGIQKIFSKETADKHDLLRMQEIITASGSLEYAKKEVRRAIEGAEKNLNASRMNKTYKTFLQDYSKEILSL